MSADYISAEHTPAYLSGRDACSLFTPIFGPIHLALASAGYFAQSVSLHRRMAGLNACLPSTLISVLPIAIDSVVVIEEVCVGCVPEGQRLDNFGILQCVPFHVFHLSSTIILTRDSHVSAKAFSCPSAGI